MVMVIDVLEYFFYGFVFVLLLFVLSIVLPRGPITTRLAAVLTSYFFFVPFLILAVAATGWAAYWLVTTFFYNTATMGSLVFAVQGAAALTIIVLIPLRTFVDIYRLDVRRDPAKDLRQYEPERTRLGLRGFDEDDEEVRGRRQEDVPADALEGNYIVLGSYDRGRVLPKAMRRGKRGHISFFESKEDTRLSIGHVIISDEPDSQGRAPAIHLLMYSNNLSMKSQFITRFESGDVVLTGRLPTGKDNGRAYTAARLATPDKLHSVMVVGYRASENPDELHFKHSAAVVPYAEPVAETEEQRHNFVVWYERWRLEHQRNIGEMIREGEYYYWTPKGALRAMMRSNAMLNSPERQANSDLGRLANVEPRAL